MKSELDIRVNVILASADDSPDRYQPMSPIEDYSRYGLIAYVKDMFTAPDPIITYLCQTHKLHDIPVGNSGTEEGIKELLKHFKKIFTEMNLYSTSISVYDNERVTTTEPVSDSKLLYVTLDTEEYDRVKAEVARIERAMEEKNKQIQQYANDVKDRQRTLEQLRSKKKDLVQRRDEKKNLETRIRQKTEAISRSEGEAIDMESEKRKLAKQLEKVYSATHQVSSQLNEAVSKSVSCYREKVESGMEMTLASDIRSKYEKKLRHASAQFEDIKSNVAKLAEEYEALKKEALEQRKVAERNAGIASGQALPKEYQDKLAEFPDTLEEINSQINALELRIEAILDTDDRVLLDYNKRKKNIEQRQLDINQKKELLTRKKASLESLKQEWLPPLKHLIENISSNFANLMIRLKCAGEVSLHVGESPVRKF